MKGINFLLTLDLIVLLIASFFLLWPFIIYLLYSIRRKELPVHPAPFETDIACIITAYKNIDLANLAAESILNQNYSKFHIYLVADNCDITDIKLPTHGKLTILVPPKKLGSKVRSMKYAIENFIRDHEAVAIFDPDNLAHSNFLYECNQYLAQGYKVVQGRRIAKNLDSRIACLDAMGEIYYNFTTRKIPFHLGSSATLAGSGMIVETRLFSGFFEEPYIKRNINNVIPGEDKVLYYYLVSEGNQIAYNENAIVYDEKISNANMVKNQRARWINAYRLSLKDSAKLLLKGIKSLNLNMFIGGVLTLYPPLFLLILLALSLSIINYFYSIYLALIGVGLVFIFVLNFIWVLKINNAPPKVWSAFWTMPYFMFNQFIGLLNIGKSNKDFLTTENNKKVSIKDIVKDN